MTELGTKPTIVPYDVDLFSRRFHLEQSVRVTAELVQSVLGESLADMRITVVDDLPEEDEAERVLVVDIVFSGDRDSFHIAYGQFISRWVKSVPPEHHKMIQFRFHIGGR